MRCQYPYSQIILHTFLEIKLSYPLYILVTVLCGSVPNSVVVFSLLCADIVGCFPAYAFSVSFNSGYEFKQRCTGAMRGSLYRCFLVFRGPCVSPLISLVLAACSRCISPSARQILHFSLARCSADKHLSSLPDNVCTC